ANPGEADVKLTSAECADAKVVQLHEVVMKDSTPIMEEIKEGIAVPAGSQAELVPGGHHIMLMMLKRRLAVGDQVTITLHFSDGGSLVVKAPVKESVVATSPARVVASPTAQASS
ncbi:copper chaperone PCu(A)C, partial [Paenibacillus glycanilyticus]|uniref:copper chaperone PCu(A)C n=1 Tax=Paenibacillus glycanilyticus TaxID=126569 RepID=UPI00203BB8E9